jgi:hypothetical protein
LDLGFAQRRNARRSNMTGYAEELARGSATPHGVAKQLVR